jgi:ABC-type multidrug transport system ATPase subunit/pSer/pThr/pTyr-binding forkhead associated (FHA) protein
MSKVIKIYDSHAIIQEIKLDSISDIKIGRAKDNDVILHDKIISRTHTIISLKGRKVFIQDESSNGTWIDNKKLTKGKEYPLSENKRVKLSNKYYLILEDKNKNHTKQTFAKDIPERVSNTKTSNSENQLYNLLQQQSKIKIGRGEQNDLILNSLLISREHAVIQVENKQYFITDMVSTNGTYINGVKIFGKVAINEEDTVTIGPYSFALNPSVKKAPTLSKYSIVAENVSKKYPNGNIGLQAMSIKIPKKEFVALMGPSGCGKSTLLKALNGDNPATGGQVVINGLVLNSANFDFIKRSIGYVPQDDIVHKELTVNDTLYYSAKLRMADDVTNKEINKRINEVLSNLNINTKEIRNTRVGKLSGGQRKRVSIAVELLNNPSILFLDEPTSPLDPETIAEFLACIQRLVKNGTSVLMVTHKPEDLSYVDKVIFLSKGGYHTYYGEPKNLLSYFKKEESIIDVYAEMSDLERGKTWNKIWLIENPLEDKNVNIEIPRTGPISESLFKQYFWLSLRYFKIKISDGVNLFLLIAQPFLIAGLITFIYDKMMVGVLFLMAISAVWFGVSNAAKEIVGELPIYNRERMYNLHIRTYLMSKLTVLALISLVQVFIFVSIISYKYTDPGLFNYYNHVAYLFFISISASIFGLFLSAFFVNTEKVMTFVPIALMPQIMLAGVVAAINSNLKAVLSYFTLGRWGTEGLCHIQEYGAEEHGYEHGVVVPNGDGYLPGNAVQDILKFYEHDDILGSFSADFNYLPINFLAIFILNAIFIYGTYWALKRKDRL